MKLRKLSLDVLLIVIIISLTFLVVTNFFITGKANSSSVSLKETENEDSIKVIYSEYKDIKLYQESSNKQLNLYSIQYAVTEHENINKEISEYIENEKQQYHNTILEQSNNNTAQNKKLHISVDIHNYKKDYYSLVFSKKELIEGVSFNQTIKTLFFNKNTGEIVHFPTVLKADGHLLQKLSTYVYHKMLENENYKEKIEIETWKNNSSSSWDNYTHFSIYNDSLELYFEPGKLGTAIDDLTSIIIPLSFINPILAEEFQSSTTSDKTIISTSSDKKTKNKRVALTFDDGPHSKYTNEILQTLEKYNSKATFFILGSHAKKHPNIVKDIAKKGHEIGNHTWSHPDLTKISLKQVKKEYKKTNDLIFTITGQYPTVFRPPYGAKNKEIIESIPIPTILWNLDTLDWKDKNAKKMLVNIKNDVKDNSIILMHDIHPSTAEGLEKVLAFLQKEGYQFVTVSELIQNK